MSYQLNMDGALDAHQYGNGVLMQFTGLLDEKGNEVYEGDIIKTVWPEPFLAQGCTIVYNEIAFRDGCFGIVSELDRAELSPFGLVDLKDAEVVGNIYQHAHLLSYELYDEDGKFRWDDARFANVRDLEPIVKGNLTNWVEWQAEFVKMQQADDFISTALAATDYTEIREAYFNERFSVKDAFKAHFYEE